MRHRRRSVASIFAAVTLNVTLGVTLAVTLGGATAPQGTDVSVTVTDMRSTKGQVLACLTMRPDAFPNCEKDPAARKLTVPAASGLNLHFGAVPQGRYAVSLIHDENGNGKLDTRLIIPREGYGFSRDAPVRMGPPKFAQAAFDVGPEPVHLAIRMRYLL